MRPCCKIRTKGGGQGGLQLSGKGVNDKCRFNTDDVKSQMLISSV